MNNDHGQGRADWVIPELGFQEETERLRQAIADWLKGVNPEMKKPLKWQFLAGSKYFRPLTMFSCARAQTGQVTNDVIRSAVALELFHNMTLVVDDILDRSDTRRGKATMHAKYGKLNALMTSGYMTAEAYRMMADDEQAVLLLSELMTRLGAAECAQWRLRRRPKGVADWRMLAQEDTGSMFEIAACLADRTGSLRLYGRYLGMLYHGCDDVSDVRGTDDLGEGGGEEDIRDGILTLPAAIATRNEDVATMFRDPKPSNYGALAAAFRSVLPAAEKELDLLASQARFEAKRHAHDPAPLIALVDRTRKLGNKG